MDKGAKRFFLRGKKKEKKKKHIMILRIPCHSDPVRTREKPTYVAAATQQARLGASSAVSCLVICAVSFRVEEDSLVCVRSIHT